MKIIENISSVPLSAQAPDPGPALDTAYVPGTPGAAWTEAEIESTRLRILQAIHSFYYNLK